MTQQRRDDKSTEFGIWTRAPEQSKEIGSHLGYCATNLDWIWQDYKRDLFMLIEEKRYRALPKFYQVILYKLLDTACKSLYKNYRGFHCLIFENTSPDDGGIYLDGKWISREELIAFLQFSSPDDWYQSYYPPKNWIKIGTPKTTTGSSNG